MSGWVPSIKERNAKKDKEIQAKKDKWIKLKEDLPNKKRHFFIWDKFYKQSQFNNYPFQKNSEREPDEERIYESYPVCRFCSYVLNRYYHMTADIPWICLSEVNEHCYGQLFTKEGFLVDDYPLIFSYSDYHDEDFFISCPYESIEQGFNCYNKEELPYTKEDIEKMLTISSQHDEYPKLRSKLDLDVEMFWCIERNSLGKWHVFKMKDDPKFYLTQENFYQDDIIFFLQKRYEMIKGE